MKYIFMTTAGVGFTDCFPDSEQNHIEFREFGKDPDQVISLIERIQGKEITREIEEIVSLCEEEQIVLTDRLLFDILSKRENLNIIFKSLDEFLTIRRTIQEWVIDNIFESSQSIYFNFIRKVGIGLAKKEYTKTSMKRDLYLIQAVAAIDDLNKTFNLICMRISEWYGLHFPELNDLIRENIQILQFVSKFGTKEQFLKKNQPFGDEKRNKHIIEAANLSLGAEILHEDLKPIIQLANYALQLNGVKNDLEEYVKSTTEKLCPNMTALVGSLLVARLIALAGSLEKLSKFPSSTIQVLGAEKALFKHLRTGEDPPKHGVIFQSPLIHQAPKHQRGKIARIIASKLSIASRIDYFSGEYRGNILLDELQRRIEEIERKYPKPTLKHKRKVEPKRKGKYTDSNRRKKERKKDYLSKRKKKKGSSRKY